MTEESMPTMEEYKAALRGEADKMIAAVAAFEGPDIGVEEYEAGVVAMVLKANHGPLGIEAASLVCAILDVTGTRELGEEGRNDPETFLDYVAGTLAEANLT